MKKFNVVDSGADSEVRLRVSDNEFQGLSEILALTDGDIREKTDKVEELKKLAGI